MFQEKEKKWKKTDEKKILMHSFDSTEQKKMKIIVVDPDRCCAQTLDIRIYHFDIEKEFLFCLFRFSDQ